MKSPILNLFLLILRIPLDYSPDTNHKNGGFSKTLLKKSLKFVLSKRDGTIIFNLGLLLLLAKVDFILKDQNYERDVLGAYGIGCVKIVRALLTKILAFHIRATII